MIRYTTPTISLAVKGANLTGKDVYVTLEQGKNKLTKKDDDLTVSVEIVEQKPITKISFDLTQDESASFMHNASVNVQVNWMSEGVRAATEIKTINVMRNLLNVVIEDD